MPSLEIDVTRYVEEVIYHELCNLNTHATITRVVDCEQEYSVKYEGIIYKVRITVQDDEYLETIKSKYSDSRFIALDRKISKQYPRTYDNEYEQQIIDWCNKSFNGRYFVSTTPHKAIFSFQRPGDAMKFKLKWC